MWTLKVSKKPNVLNLQFKFCPPPKDLLGRGGAKIRIFPPQRFISVYNLAATALIAGSGYKAIEIRKFEFEAKI